MSNDGTIIERHEFDWARLYKIVKNGKTYWAPSVTTCLSVIPNEDIEKWRDAVGHDNANLISYNGTSRGSVMHKYLENFIIKFSETRNHEEALLFSQIETKNSDELKGFTDKHFKIGRGLFYNFYSSQFYSRIKTVIGNEIYLYSVANYPYAGTCDYIFMDWDNNLIIVDFKSAKKPKDSEHISGYKKQISAYMNAYHELYGVKPKSGEVWMSNEQDHEIQKFIISWDESLEHYTQFNELAKIWNEKWQHKLSQL